MKKSFLICSILLTSLHSFCQSAISVIAEVIKKQQSIKTVSYTLKRTDTLVTGDIRTMEGKAFIAVDKTDSIFGFYFRAQMDGENTETVYLPHSGYQINMEDKTYSLTTNPSQLSELLYGYGGHIVLPDFVKLDTARAIAFTVLQDSNFYQVTLTYPDLAEYDVIKRTKTITIDKKTMLIAAVRSHQETLNKVQYLNYQIKQVHINETAFDYSLIPVNFYNEYSQRIEKESTQLLSLKGRNAPAFKLTSFDDEIVSSKSFKGKLVLLDFWEVWCGPCIESMPKMEHLYAAYKSKGLNVYGIINDTRQLDAAKLMVKKKNIAFTMLTGNEQLKKDYQLSGVPLYVLINSQGKIVFFSEGYTDEIENVIKSELLK